MNLRPHCCSTYLLESFPHLNFGLFHVTDWLPTLYTAAGGNAKDLGPIDGLDQWASLAHGKTSPRLEMLYGIRLSGGGRNGAALRYSIDCFLKHGQSKSLLMKNHHSLQKKLYDLIRFHTSDMTKACRSVHMYVANVAASNTSVTTPPPMTFNDMTPKNSVPYPFLIVSAPTPR